MLSKIEKKLFIEINMNLNKLINDSNIEKLERYFDEDLNFILNIIDELIKLLSQEKEMINDLI
jgi:hypothetical protein